MKKCERKKKLYQEKFEILMSMKMLSHAKLSVKNLGNNCDHKNF